ncbi:MAG: hypothetical protein AB7G13_20300 [Lautropia sp.]
MKIACIFRAKPNGFASLVAPMLVASLLALAASLSACQRAEPDRPAAPATGSVQTVPAASPNVPAAADTATGPAAGGSAIGGVAGGQDRGGGASGTKPAPTGGDGSDARPAVPR